MSRRKQLIAEATGVVVTLFRKHGIESFSDITRAAKDQFSQEDLDAYEAALKQLENNGGI